MPVLSSRKQRGDTSNHTYDKGLKRDGNKIGKRIF